MTQQSFDSWLTETQPKRDEITAFSKVAIVNVDKAIDYSGEWGLMENKADAFVKVEFAKSLRESKSKYPDATAKEREVYVKSDLSTMFNFVSDLSIIGRVLRDRIYNKNSSR